MTHEGARTRGADGESEGRTYALPIQRYVDALTRPGGEVDARLFSLDAVCEEPLGGEVRGGASASRALSRLGGAFDEASFELVDVAATAKGALIQWAFSGVSARTLFERTEPTGARVELAGVDVVRIDGDRVAHVRRVFDRHALAERMGLGPLVQPIRQGRAEFGYSMRVASGNSSPPGIVALTWIAAADAKEKERIVEHARANVSDFLDEPGFVSIVTGFMGLRGFTVTAWEDEASMKRALSRNHAKAAKELFSERFVSSVWTSVWQPTRINRLWLRCAACGSLENVSSDPRTCGACGRPFPERPAYW